MLHGEHLPPEGVQAQVPPAQALQKGLPAGAEDEAAHVHPLRPEAADVLPAPKAPLIQMCMGAPFRAAAAHRSTVPPFPVLLRRLRVPEGPQDERVVLMLGVVISLFHRTAVFLPLLGFVSTFFARRAMIFSSFSGQDP